MRNKIAILPANIDFTRKSLIMVTMKGTTADWIRNGRMKSGTTRSKSPFFLPRPAERLETEKNFYYFTTAIEDRTNSLTTTTCENLLQCVLVEVHIH